MYRETDIYNIARNEIGQFEPFFSLPYYIGVELGDKVMMDATVIIDDYDNRLETILMCDEEDQVYIQRLVRDYQNDYYFEDDLDESVSIFDYVLKRLENSEYKNKYEHAYWLDCYLNSK